MHCLRRAWPYGTDDMGAQPQRTGEDYDGDGRRRWRQRRSGPRKRRELFSTARFARLLRSPAICMCVHGHQVVAQYALLSEKIIESGQKMLRKTLPPTTEIIRQVVAAECSYINTK